MTMKVLIVDDSFVNRKILRKFLEEYASIDIVVNGREAVDAVKLAHMERAPYELVLLDIMMPEMDGLETLRAIRDYEKSHNILTLQGVKVIMVTALSDSKNIMNAFKEGCESYIVKPVSKQALYQEMSNLGLALEKR